MTSNVKNGPNISTETLDAPIHNFQLSTTINAIGFILYVAWKVPIRQIKSSGMILTLMSGIGIVSIFPDLTLWLL
jgi:hypothetical protein